MTSNNVLKRYKRSFSISLVGSTISGIMITGMPAACADCTPDGASSSAMAVSYTHLGRQLRFAFTSGTQFPDNLSPYQLVIHCGGCMLNDREMKYRLRCAKDQGIPITNYGTAIAHMKGILKRSTSIFSL